MNLNDRNRRYRNRLLVSTAMAGATLLGLGQNADAACTPAAPPNYVCSGVNTTGQIVPTTIGLPLDLGDFIALALAPANPSVTTDPGFSVTTSDPFALGILGSGAVSYTDANSSALSSTTGIGLGVVSLVPQVAPPHYGANPGGAVTIDTNGALTGALIGLAAINTGDGATAVNATGDITATGANGYGVVVYSLGSDADVTTGKVSGTNVGISAINQGATAALNITANGDVTGGTGDGIHAVNGGQQLDVVNTILNGTVTFSGPTVPAGSDLNVTAYGKVTGGRYGIFASNDGSGATSIIATMAAVAGSSEDGIYATNGTTATDLTVSAAAVSGKGGIAVTNNGTGFTSVTATGLVTGASNNGIDAYTDGAGLTVSAAAVNGGFAGIYAQNNGTGATSVTATGTVTGTVDNGIDVYTTGTGLTVNAVAVTGGTNGIRAYNSGNGATGVTATGMVTGIGTDGIYAFNAATATGGLTIDVTAVNGHENGINADNRGTGATTITATGTVEGGDAAIKAVSSAGQAISITTSGLVRNNAQTSAALAIDASGGPVAFNNNGTLIGTVKLGAAVGNVVTNGGNWATAGGSNAFSGGTLVNNIGNNIYAANLGATVAVTTTFNGLASFTNKGQLSMMNDVAGDITEQTGGNAAFAAGSVLAVDVSGASADKFTTTGTADITDAILGVRVGGLAIGTYTVLTANGGLTGTFNSVTGVTSTPFLSVTDTYDANNAYLDVTKVRDFADAGLTPNQIATGEGLDSLTGGAVFNAVAGLATDAEAQAAFDQLSGEIHASAKGMLVEDSRFVRDAATSRIRAAFGDVGAAALPVMAYDEGGPEMVAADTDRFAVWGQAFGSWGSTDSDGNAAAFDRSTGGLLAGADTLVGGWRVGLLGGYSHSSFDADDRNSSGKSDSYHLGLYGGTNWGAIAFRTGAAYSWSSLSTKRSVAFNGFTDGLSADYDAGTAQVFGELAYKADAGQFRFEPFANLAYVSVHTDGFTEDGGDAALTSAGTSTDATFTTLGLRGSSDFAFGGMNVTARGMLGWRHAFGDVTPTSSFAFAGGDAFTIAGVPIARDSAVVEAGLDFNMSANATLGLAYTGQFGGGTVDQGAKVDLAVKF
ncbi:autotransporter domain-containing protein [Mesorhizobium sp. M7A.F.Ca.CA.004.02.1.1]|uniref:autotransporter outer membrane beta-barrel domain-containing protein n=2 Tax=unclassified Mesorhizobium TaxID=325217 RepID=UPI000FCAC136|nr:autotransporter domain-containing protein [Mesorhizobium sp. M7A.F.Ca.CA.004.02.1.1]RVB02258.1 autotransporter outer membrane beta-barrel domain-containing protein [Mesorhizobium sp. M7A.F.Ca.CA.004.02.1.1]